ncbi:MAG: glycosyltransferase [Methanothrix sp.]
MSKEKRLIMFNSYYPPEVDPSGLRISEMARTFSKDINLKVRVVIYNPQSDIKNDNITRENVEYFRYERRYLPKRLHLLNQINPFTFMHWIFIVYAEILKYKPDIIITTVPTYIPTIAAYILSPIHMTPFCVDIRDNWVDTSVINYFYSISPWYLKFPSLILNRLFHYLFIKSCRKASLISIVYDDLRNILLKYNIKNELILFIPNGVNLSKINSAKKQMVKEKIFNKYGINSDRITLIYAGGVGGYYRPDIILDAVENLVKDGLEINYIIAGSGNLLDNIRLIVKQKKIENYVFVLGPVEHDEAINLLMCSDIGIYGLKKDFHVPKFSLGLKVLEYIACKLPILSISDPESSVYRLIIDYNLGISLGWDELQKSDSSIKQLIEMKNDYLTNIEEYYPIFLENFDREKNNKKLYDRIIKLAE